MQITLLSTGAKTGTTRRATLYAWEDADRLILVGSRGGSKRNPGWVHNLRAHPVVTVLRGKTQHAYRAREAFGEERTRLWRLAADRFPLYDRYAERTERQIPVFLLERTD